MTVCDRLPPDPAEDFSVRSLPFWSFIEEMLFHLEWNCSFKQGDDMSPRVALA
jgi:hypothetical protein